MSELYLKPRFYSSFNMWLFGHLLKNKYYFIATYILLIVTTFITVTIPLILKSFFDTAIQPPPKGSPEIILLTAITFLGLYFLNFIFSIISSACNAMLSEYTVRNVQQEFFSTIHRKNMSFHDSSRAGNLLSMGTSDSRQLSGMFSSIRLFTVAIFTIIGVLITMYILSPGLTYIFVLFLPLIIISMYWYSRRIGPVSLERQQLFGAWQATLQENLSGIRALRTLSNRDREWQKYLKDLYAVKDVLIRRSKISSFYIPTLLIYIAMGVIFVYGSYLVFIGRITTGTLIAFNALVILTQQPNQQIRGSFFMGAMGFAGGRRIFDVITNEMETNDGFEPVKINGDISFKHVFFKYQNIQDENLFTLKDISFDIKAGESVAIIGHTGCGKSTVTKLIQRLYDIYSGSIEIDGRYLSDFYFDLLRRQIGVIEQDIFLFSATIRENILFGYSDNISPELEERMISVSKSAQIHDFIMSLPKGYETIIGERGITLSGGQRQRIAIARAFMIDPPILILDDATSSVDAKTEAQIQKAITNLVVKRTSIIITHRLSTLLKADKIILMERGEIKDFGTHTELYKRQEYYASIFKQFENLPIIPKIEV